MLGFRGLGFRGLGFKALGFRGLGLLQIGGSVRVWSLGWIQGSALGSKVCVAFKAAAACVVIAHCCLSETRCKTYKGCNLKPSFYLPLERETLLVLRMGLSWGPLIIQIRRL